MKAKKLIRYRVSVSRTFPATHPRKGDLTFFVEKIESATLCRKSCFGECEMCSKHRWVTRMKRHTIRGNYERWVKRFEKIDRGEAVLELYYWDGKPYGKGVEQITICQLGKEDGVGLQKLQFMYNLYNNAEVEDCKYPSISEVSENDGLSREDFKAWFKGADLSKPMAIIHFTSFRY